MEDWQKGGFGIYIHWPFCAAKCPYCDFNSHVRRAIDHDRWRAALISELKHAANLTRGRKVDTVFFGGGTPSLMDPKTVDALINTIATEWSISNAVEINLEANPTSVEAEKFQAFADAGVNRVSMGVQALNDPDLKRLGRMHSAAEAMAAFDIAKAHFTRVSFDLIYARQDQSLTDWKTELNSALNLAVDHLSLYQLTIEPQTRFGDLYDKGKLRGLPSDDLSADMYALTQELTEAAGMPAYEISNHAGTDAQSRHNLVYWRYGDYVGIGPGAHGRLTLDGHRTAIQSPSHPENWLNQVEANSTATAQTEHLTPSDQAIEYLMMSLRLTEGSDPMRFEALNGTPIKPQRIRDLVSDGLLETEGTGIKASPKGRMVLNSVLSTLLS